MGLLTGRYCRAKDMEVTSWMSVAVVNHSFSTAAVSGSSQSRSSCHNFCIRILAFTVTGDKMPMGSNTLDVSRNTSRFVTNVWWVGIGLLRVKEIVSLAVSHWSPKTFTKLGSVAVPSCLACSINLLLFEAQLLRLKLAPHIIDLAMV